MSLVEFRNQRESIADLPPFQLAKFAIAGIGIVFAALGMGEAVYRILFLEFDGATDRLPIETMFGFAFAYVTVKFLMRRHRRRVLNEAKLEVIRRRNEKIRAAVTAIDPLPHPGHQQAIRVIREEVDSIRWNLSDILPE